VRGLRCHFMLEIERRLKGHIYLCKRSNREQKQLTEMVRFAGPRVNIGESGTGTTVRVIQYHQKASTNSAMYLPICVQYTSSKQIINNMYASYYCSSSLHERWLFYFSDFNNLIIIYLVWVQYIYNYILIDHD